MTIPHRLRQRAKALAANYLNARLILARWSRPPATRIDAGDAISAGHDDFAGLMPRKSAFSFSMASADRPADFAATSTALVALSLSSASIFLRVSPLIFF